MSYRLECGVDIILCRCYMVLNMALILCGGGILGAENSVAVILC